MMANLNIYLIFTSAPSSNKHCTTLTLPSIAAKCNAVLESSSPSLIQLLSLVASSFITLKEVDVNINRGVGDGGGGGFEYCIQKLKLAVSVVVSPSDILFTPIYPG